MKQYLKEKGVLLLTFIFFYMLIEYITFKWVDFKTLPKSFYIDFLFALGVGSLSMLFKTFKGSVIYITSILSIVMALFLINATMYSVYFDLFTLQQLTLLKEAKTVFNFDFLSVNSIFTSVFIALIYFIVLKTLWKKKYQYCKTIPNYYRKTALVLTSIFLFIFISFGSGTKTFERFLKINNITTFKRASLEEFGMLGYYLKETQVIVLGSSFEELLDEDYDVVPVLESLPTNFFGEFEGANIITIMVESLQSFAVNEILTPNLYRLTQEGLYFPNHYSENKTNVSEIIGMAGHYPTIQLLPNIYDYDFSNSLPSILSENYETAFFHDNIGSFYSRSRLIPMIGFENNYTHDDLFPNQERWTWNGDYTLDSETIEKVMEFMFNEEEPFYYFWSTMSMHGPYDYGPENKLLFEQLGYFDIIDQAEENGEWINILHEGATVDQWRIRHYQAAVMDFDVALGKLFNALIERDLLDNTILVLYGDHNVYYHDLNLMINNTDASEYFNMDMYQTFFAIYNPSLTAIYKEYNETNVIDKFVSPYNIVPTLLDLLGKSYNQHLFLGESVFTDRHEVFYSNKLTAFFDINIFSNDGYDIVYLKEEQDQDYLDGFFATCEENRLRLEIINHWFDSTKKIRE